MFPDDSALIPALACVACDRLIPRTAISYHGRGSEKAQLNRALRAFTRAQMRKEALDAAASHAPGG